MIIREAKIDDITQIQIVRNSVKENILSNPNSKDKTFNATMETHFDPNLPKVEIISKGIDKVLLNLITNAFYLVNERSRKSEEIYEPKVTITT